VVSARKSRRRERGAAVFIVVMVITLLTAIGIFAIRSATLVDQAAGFQRQGLQTAYLTEYAGRAVTAELGDGAAKSYLDRVRLGTDKCQVNLELEKTLPPGMPPPPCYKLYISEIGSRVQSHYATSTVLEKQTAIMAGSLGGRVSEQAHALEGVFVVEMTEPYESVPNAGSEQAANASNAFRDVQLTLTAFGQVRPIDTAGVDDPWCGASASSTSASVSALRAHITLRSVPR
jgi:Tfp pilus assembly protein PilX